MKLKINRANKNWCKSISDEDIYNREFSIGYLINSNLDIELFRLLDDLVLSTYTVTARFRYLGYNGDKLVCNNQVLVSRPNKFSDYILGKNVKEISSNLSHKGGGSNRYPSIGYEGAEIVLEFISYGLPHIDKVNGWECKILKIEKAI